MTLRRGIGLYKIDFEGKAKKVFGETVLHMAFQTVSSQDEIDFKGSDVIETLIESILSLCNLL